MSQVFQSGFPFCKNHFYFDSEVNCFNSVVFLKGGVGMPLMKGGIPWFFQLFFSFHWYIQSSFHDYILELASLNLFFLNVLKMKKHWKKYGFKSQFRLRLHWRKKFSNQKLKKKILPNFFSPSAFFTSAWPKLTNFVFEQNAQVQIFRLYWLFQEAKKH